MFSIFYCIFGYVLYDLKVKYNENISEHKETYIRDCESEAFA